jgi:hypothetical protein
VHDLPAVDDETIDAEILDARDVPDEPHDGVRLGCGRPRSSRSERPLVSSSHIGRWNCA